MRVLARRLSTQAAGHVLRQQQSRRFETTTALRSRHQLKGGSQFLRRSPGNRLGGNRLGTTPSVTASGFFFVAMMRRISLCLAVCCLSVTPKEDSSIL